MNESDWEELLTDASARVRAKVSALDLAGGRTAVGIGASGDKTLLADKAAEDVLLGTLAEGGVRILSEEAGLKGEIGAQTLAVIDPLDGSSNYERGIPFYCTSVAIVDGESLDGITIGVVRDLVSGDVFVGRRGKGATKNGRPVRVSGTTKTADAVLGIDLSRSPADGVIGLAPLVSGVRRQVHFGANALELCYLADGRIDAFVDLRGKIRITDFAAAYLIAVEAGAVFTGVDGGEVRPAFNLEHRFGFVASANKTLHKEILRLCQTPTRKR